MAIIRFLANANDEFRKWKGNRATEEDDDEESSSGDEDEEDANADDDGNSNGVSRTDLKELEKNRFFRPFHAGRA